MMIETRCMIINIFIFLRFKSYITVTKYRGENSDYDGWLF